ncbi:MAG: ThiF family adenylyltransferase [Nitrososphaeria archaeon]
MGRTMEIDAKKFFERNLGIFFEEEQAILENKKVMLVGVGGIGGTCAIILARTGIRNFLLIDSGVYDPPDMNRQVGCFIDTLGKYKVDVIKEHILKINPTAEVQTLNRKLTFDELGKLMDNYDIVIAEADDLAYSTHVLILAQKKGKVSITAMPVGFTGYVMMFAPNKEKPISPAELFGIPGGMSYEELSEFLDRRENKCGREWYVTDGKWRVDYFRKWMDGEAAIAQVCANVWLMSSFMCMEIIKYFTGVGEPVLAPKMWQMIPSKNKIKAVKFRWRTYWFNKLALKVFSIKFLGLGKRWRKIAWDIFMKKMENREKKEKVERERRRLKVSSLR